MNGAVRRGGRGKRGGCRGERRGGGGGGGTFDAESRSLITSKRRSIARGANPGISFEPSIVCVLPEPDWPYAKMQTLYPSSTEVISSAESLNTCSCVDFGP